MKHELFVEQPNTELKEGIKVSEGTELTYKNHRVEQELKGLVLKTILREEGTNGFNTYKSESNVTVTLNAGDILLFHEERGYYLPAYPMVSIADAISDISSLDSLPRFTEEKQ